VTINYKDQYEKLKLNHHHDSHISKPEDNKDILNSQNVNPNDITEIRVSDSENDTITGMVNKTLSNNFSEILNNSSTNNLKTIVNSETKFKVQNQVLKTVD